MEPASQQPDAITKLRSDLRNLFGRHPASPQLRRDFMLFTAELDTFIGVAVDYAEDELPKELPASMADAEERSWRVDYNSPNDTEKELDVAHKPKPDKDDKVAKVLHEYKAGSLHSGSKAGPIVTDPRQARAIALAEQEKKDKKGGK